MQADQLFIIWGRFTQRRTFETGMLFSRFVVQNHQIMFGSVWIHALFLFNLLLFLKKKISVSVTIVFTLILTCKERNLKRLHVYFNFFRNECFSPIVNTGSTHRLEPKIKWLGRFAFIPHWLYLHPVGRISNSDCFIDSFKIVANKIFFSSVRIWCPKNNQKNVLIDNHCKSIYVPVRIGYSSVRVYHCSTFFGSLKLPSGECSVCAMNKISNDISQISATCLVILYFNSFDKISSVKEIVVFCFLDHGGFRVDFQFFVMRLCDAKILFLSMLTQCEKRYLFF